MSVRVRFAPSPTGYLHIGGARTALFNWLFARRHGGTFILRIEDTDLQRSRAEYEAQILEALRWLGLDWDEGPVAGGEHGPYRQSERMARYDHHIEQLIDQGRAYRCDMTAEDLEALRTQQRERGEKPGYDRRNRDRDLGPGVGPHVVRLKMPTEGSITVHDLIKGPVTFQATELDDWVLRRTDGSYTYNFVVVIDDHEMDISHVVRGDDHLNNTPKQIALYEQMGWQPPAFAHLPLILGADGSRLSKRHAATSVGEYQEMGVPPEALVNYLTRLGWAHGEMEEFTTEESAAVFSLEAVNKTGAKWDMDKLLWLSQQWIKRLDLADLAGRLGPFLPEGASPDNPRLPAIASTLRERSRTLRELGEKSAFYFVPDGALAYDEEAVKKHLKPAIAPHLQAIVERLSALDAWDEPSLEAAVSALLAERELKLGKLAQPIRVALTGQGVGPGLYETLNALGREPSLARLQRALALATAA